MNNNDYMVDKKSANELQPIDPLKQARKAFENMNEKVDAIGYDGFAANSEMHMVKRSDVNKGVVEKKIIGDQQTEKEAEFKDFGNDDKTKEVTKVVEQQQAQAKAQVQETKTEAPQATSAPTPAPTQPASAVSNDPKKLSMSSILTIDDLVGRYISLFEQHFGLKLSSTICFENVRKLCEINVKNPDKNLYFLENTYRVSSLIYLTSNLPILIVASILAEKNRKNILNYVTTEVENGAKRYEDLKELRINRWNAKFNNMQINDAMTVTPGVTSLSPELIDLMTQNFENMCVNLKKFNKELSDIVSAFDETTKNDVIYIYSNWWYLLQGFENVSDMRTYIMTITDDTRKNLQL